ncbi:hypothetical protein H2201_003595 [Coniosporium apollinis]|uniref:Uncharacterized protein n=1 Tax=Coniosporium apollinis TaxID=61459 RepID=A0ABQ9NVJ0_9PEZI|nr:hypothetical protein H2201_003595 [Coniosporium apollinis]
MVHTKHQEEYPKAMRGLGYGYAVYHPVETSKLYAGAYGYFDEEGDWFRLGDICDAEGCPNLDSTKPFAVKALLARDVHEVQLGFDAKAPVEPAGNIGVHMKYETSSEFGAVLLARPLLKKHQYQNEEFFKRWGEQNFAALRAENSILETYGLWIITKTCQTPYCAIATFGGKRNAISAGFTAEAYKGGKLQAGGRWYLENQSGAWRTFGGYENEDSGAKDEGEAADAGAEAEDVVIFFAGYRIKPSRMPWGRPYADEMRAVGPGVSQVKSHDGEVLECEHWDGKNF